MATDIKNKYHVAINTAGYILRGAPNTPAYTRSVVPSQVNRLAISDLAYSDFAGAGLFYLAQTDWSAGVKTESIWRDDAKYYYSTNLDTYSSQGEIKAEKEVVLDNEFVDDVYCAAAVSVNGSTNSYLGTYKTSGANIKIFKYTSSWGDIASATFATNQNSPSYLVGHKGKLWVGTVGTGDADVVEAYDGTSWVDHSAAIITAMTGWSSVKASRAACEVGSTLYVGIEDYLNNKSGIVTTVDNGANWVVLRNLSYYNQIISMASFMGKLYYLEYNTSNAIELRVYDPVATTDSSVRMFTGINVDNTGVWDKYLKVFDGKLIITIPNSKIYSFDGNDLINIYTQDTKKTAIGYEAGTKLYKGCVEKGEKLYWGNLIYDGDGFFNYKKPLTDLTNKYLYPIFVNSSDSLYYKDENSTKKTYIDNSTYKATTANNFVVFNEMAPVVSIDKLLYSITAIFEKMISGDQIKIEYSIDNRSSWVTAGTLTYTSEGGTNVKRELIIPNSILFNKIWWRVSMANTNGTSSPTLLDLIMAYQPLPNYKNKWQMRLDMSDGIKLLNKQNDSREGYDMNAQLWNEKLLKKQVKFQDIDYIECTLKTAMTKTQTSASISAIKRLPIQGRIRAVSGLVAEEMYYTSAKNDKILGIVRGVRGTTARAYLSGQVLDNGYNVYVEDITSNLNFTDENKTESIAQVLLIEA